MKISASFKEFQKNHFNKKHQVLFKSKFCKEYYKVENLFRFLLAEKNSFIFESVEKGKNRGRYTIIGLNPDKIWDVNNNVITINTLGREKKIKSNPLIYINKLIKSFNIKIPKQLPSMSSMLVGYFSYDIIRYIENIPDRTKDDLMIPDIRLSRPKNLMLFFLEKSNSVISKVLGTLSSSLAKPYLLGGRIDLRIPPSVTLIFGTNDFSLGRSSRFIFPQS